MIKIIQLPNGTYLKFTRSRYEQSGYCYTGYLELEDAIYRWTSKRPWGRSVFLKSYYCLYHHPPPRQTTLWTEIIQSDRFVRINDDFFQFSWEVDDNRAQWQQPRAHIHRIKIAENGRIHKQQYLGTTTMENVLSDNPTLP